VSQALYPRLDRATANLRARGFEVTEGQCLRASHKHVSASKEARAAEFMDFYCQDDIDAIFPPWGGDLLIEILPLLHFDQLKAARPKWVIGYSDTSTLLLPLTIMLDIATLHASNLMEAVAAQTTPLSQSLFEVLKLDAGDLITQASSTSHQMRFADFGEFPDAPFDCTEPTSWKALSGDPEARFSGRLIGGCIDTIGCLVGTVYGSVPSFANRYKEDGIVLYLENCELAPPMLFRFLYNLRLAGWTQHLSGILIGRSAAADATDPRHLSYRETLQATLGDLSCPVLYDVDIGHKPPQMSLINGAVALVKFASGKSQIVQSLI